MKYLLVFLVFVLPAEAQHVVIKHTDYTSYYNPVTGEPDSVSFTLTPQMGQCKTKLSRLNKFIADPAYPDTKFNTYYEGSGYDQGHQFDADDASCSGTDEKECWYFTNMVPQKPNLNRITWRELENYTRKLALKQNVFVTCGVTGSLGYIVGIDKNKTKHPSKISIPEYCWKRLRYGKTTEFYIMPNCDSVKRHPFIYYRL